MLTKKVEGQLRFQLLLCSLRGKKLILMKLLIAPGEMVAKSMNRQGEGFKSLVNTNQSG